MAETILDEIAQACGAEFADALRRHFGGGNIYVPCTPRPGSAQVAALGLDATARLCRALGPGKLYVPLPGLAGSALGAEVARLSSRGLSAREIGRRLACSERTVYRWLARLS
jgi:hypothetical protein